MIQGLHSALGWSSSHIPQPGYSILIGDHIECDAFPLLVNLIQFYLNNGIPVCWISFREPLASSIDLFRRLGCDLPMLEAQDLLLFCDGISNILHGDFKTLEAKASDFVTTKPNSVVIYDELSLTEPLNNAFPSITTLISSLTDINTVSSVMYMRDDEESKLYRWLMHRSSTIIETRPLSSGISRDFHGQILFRPGGRSCGKHSAMESSMLFKTTATSLYMIPKGSSV